MTRRALILLVLLLSACTAVRSPGPGPATMPARALPGRGAQSGHGAIVEVRIVYEDGFVQVVSSGVDTATPQATNTRTPVPSATRTATVTPPPTNTPRSTSTASPTPTPTSLIELESTPTPEDFNTPSSTPRPTSTVTPTSTPPLSACMYVVTADPALNVRVSPNVLTGAVLGQVVKDQKLRPNGYVMVNGMKWYQIWWLPDQVGYVRSDYVTQQTGTDCSTLPEITALLTTFLDGLHSLAGEGVGVLLNPLFVHKYKILKCLDGGFSVCEQAKAANPSLKTVYRTYQHDCIPLDYLDDPDGARKWWNVIKGALPPGATWYEISNECDPGIEHARQWALFMIDMAQIVEQERGAALLAFSSGPGNPDFGWWRDMWVYVDWAAGRVAPNGAPHGIATHSSGYAPASIVLPSGSWINNPYIAGREKIVCDLARANHYGADCNSIVWINTELGVTDGYQGDKETFTCAQKGIMYKETIRRKIADGVVDGFLWWNVGKIGAWTNDGNCLAEMLL